MSHIEPKLPRGIVAAACQMDGLTFSMPAPARHHDVLQSMHVAGIQCALADQGFLDHRGVFVGRKGAMIVAYQFGQLKEGEFDDGGDLFSEHLW
jgi:hypothetical protein